MVVISNGAGGWATQAQDRENTRMRNHQRRGWTSTTQRAAWNNWTYAAHVHANGPYWFWINFAWYVMVLYGSYYGLYNPTKTSMRPEIYIQQHHIYCETNPIQTEDPSSISTTQKLSGMSHESDLMQHRSFHPMIIGHQPITMTKFNPWDSRSTHGLWVVLHERFLVSHVHKS